MKNKLRRPNIGQRSRSYVMWGSSHKTLLSDLEVTPTTIYMRSTNLLVLYCTDF